MRRITHQILAMAMTLAACGGTGVVDSVPTSSSTLSTNPTTTVSVAVETEPDSEEKSSPVDEDAIELTWFKTEFPRQGFPDEIVVTGDGYIGYNLGPNSGAWTSNDGVTWVEANVSFDLDDEVFLVGDVVPTDRGYAAIGGGPGEDPVLLVSKDGLSWTGESIELMPPDDSEFWLESLLATPEGVLVLAGSSVIEDPGGGHEHGILLWVSDDGARWDLIPDPFGEEVLIGGVIAIRSGLIAHGFVDGPDGGSRLWASADGVSWEDLGPGPSSGDGQMALWGDRLVMTSYEPDGGVGLWVSDDGRDWTRLPGHQSLSGADEYTPFVGLIAAGPYGLALVGDRMAIPAPEPDVAIAKDGLTITILLENFSFIVVDDATGEVLSEGDLDGPNIRYEDDVGVVVFLDVETGEDLVSITPKEFDEARRRTYGELGIIPPEDRYDESIHTLWFSPDGDNWASVAIEEATGHSGWVLDVIVGVDSLLLIMEGAPEEPSEDAGHEENPGTIWVGSLSE